MEKDPSTGEDNPSFGETNTKYWFLNGNLVRYHLKSPNELVQADAYKDQFMESFDVEYKFITQQVEWLIDIVGHDYKED